MAATRVFGTVELLEQILLNLSTKDVLLVQRVSKDFKGTIDGSTGLQKVLFFQPVSATHDYLRYSNPLLPPLYDNFDAIWTRITLSTYSPSHRHPQEHPLYRPEASWRRMLAHQPPARYAPIEAYEWRDNRPYFMGIQFTGMTTPIFMKV